MENEPKVVYRYSRLTFHRDSIEPLKANDLFRIETPAGAFVMSKGDFYATFPGVVKSASYIAKGLFNYAKTPKKAMRFQVRKHSSSGAEITRRGQYGLPSALRGLCTETAYKRWLHRKAVAHVIRDRKRWQIPLAITDYKKAIHAAVIETGTNDAYTGDALDWGLISKYDNEKSKAGRSAYKKTLALLPTVDHAGDAPGDMNFRICAWRTNDSKSDLTLEEFIQLCRRVLRHNGLEAS